MFSAPSASPCLARSVIACDLCDDIFHLLDNTLTSLRSGCGWRLVFFLCRTGNSGKDFEMTEPVFSDVFCWHPSLPTDSEHLKGTARASVVPACPQHLPQGLVCGNNSPILLSVTLKEPWQPMVTATPNWDLPQDDGPRGSSRSDTLAATGQWQGGVWVCV